MTVRRAVEVQARLPAPACICLALILLALPVSIFADDERCLDVVLFSVCGDHSKYVAVSKRYPYLFNLSETEEKEVRENLANILETAPSEDSRTVVRDSESEEVWNGYLQTITPGLRLFGSYLFFDENLNEVIAQGPLRFSVSSAVRIGQHYFIDTEILEEFKKLVPADRNLRMPERLLLNDRPAFTIHLDDARRPVSYDEVVIQSMCESILQTPLAKARMNSSDPNDPLSRVYSQECPGVLKSELQSVFDNGPLLLDLANDYYALTWAIGLWLDVYKRHLLAEPRRVFVVPAAEGVSPRVDFFGNLYIPKYIHDNLVPAEEYERLVQENPGATQGLFSSEQLTLIIMHELAHIALMPFELSRMVGAIWTNESMMRFLEEGHATSQITPDQLREYMTPLMQFFRAPDEAFVDVLVAWWISSDQSLVREYPNLVERLEVSMPQRRQLIEIASPYFQSSGTANRFFALLSMSMMEQFEMLSLGFQIESAAEAEILEEYSELYLEYWQARWVRTMSSVFQPGNSSKQSLSPWHAQEEMTDFYESLAKGSVVKDDSP